MKYIINQKIPSFDHTLIGEKFTKLNCDNNQIIYFKHLPNIGIMI